MANPHLSTTMVLLLTFVIAVAVTDLRSHRIPNLLTVPAAALGMLANVVSAGGSGALASAGGVLVGLAAFLPFYFARGFGAGDVKAMAAIGAYLGPQGALLAAACTLMAGAVCAVLVLTARGGYPAIQSLLRRCMSRAGVLLATGQAPQIEPPPGDAALQRFPYGVAITCGTIASLYWT